MKELTAKQRAFVREYSKDRNGTQAAIRAGYSPKTAQEQSSRLLSNAMVAAELAEIEKGIEKRAAVTVDFVLGILTDIAIDGAQPGSARVNAARSLGEHIGMWPKGVAANREHGDPEREAPRTNLPGDDDEWRNQADA